MFAFNGVLGNHLSVQQPAAAARAQPAPLPSLLTILKWDLELWGHAEESRGSLLGWCKQDWVVCPAPCCALQDPGQQLHPRGKSQGPAARWWHSRFHLGEHIYSYLYFGGACPCSQHTAFNSTCCSVVNIPLCHLNSSSSIHITGRLVRRNIWC